MFKKHKYHKLEYLSDGSSTSDVDSTTFIISSSQTLADKRSLDFSDDSTDGIKLQRTIGISSGVSVVVGSMIGSGIFIVPAGVLAHCNGDMTLSMIVWVLGGIVALVVALCFCELGTLIPESGGMAPFLKAIYGDLICFIFLWIFLLTACPQGLAVQIMALGDYISEAVGVGLGICSENLTPNLSKLIGFLITLLLFVCNMTNVKLAVKLQIWCTTGKVAALIIISFVGMLMLILDSSTLAKNFHYSQLSQFHGDLRLSNMSRSSLQQTLMASVHASPGLPGLTLAVFQALWAYDGFDNITCITEEVKNPRKSLPVIIIVSIAIVMSLYLIVNISYFSVLTQKEMLSSDAVAVSFAAKVHPWLAYVVTAGVCLSLIGSINITFLASGRMPFVAGRMGFMPKVLSMVHVKYFSPVPALIFLCILGAIMLLPSNIDMLLKAVVFTLWAFRTLCCAGVLILRRKLKNANRPYKVYKMTAVLATLVGTYMVVSPLVYKPQSLYLLTLTLVLLFAFFYYLIKKGVLSLTKVGKRTVALQKLLLIIASDKGDSKLA